MKLPIAGVAILLWSAEPEAPHKLVTPFFHASAAAALDMPVEIYFTARSVLLLEPGVGGAARAASLRASPLHEKTVYDAMREAVALGVELLACSDALQAHGLGNRPLIPECTRRAGAVQFMDRVCDPAWRTLVF